GYGPIAAVMEHRFPGAKVWGIDVNRRAIELAKRNTRSEETVICAPDEVPEDIAFDLIWSNPPIRIGKENLKMVLTRWLGRLHLSGVAYLVINKNLGADSVQKWLENESWETSRLKSLKGYRLLEVKHHV
ncbi:MAG: methyltransferase, partial [Actinomycetota bacterium]|nr:methyltransferase [Actinomycetota bacterium]